MLTFAAAVFFLIITPGPGVLSTAGIGAAYGYRPGLAYVFGLFLGNNLVALAVISGLWAVVLGIPGLRLVLMIASTAYLIYLASRIAFAGSKIAFIEAKAPPGVLAGLALQPINPKAYAVNTTLFAGFPYAVNVMLFSNFAFMPDALVAEAIIKLLIFNAIWVPLHLGWLWAGVTLHRLNLPDTTQRRINYALALSMLIVVALAVWSGLDTK